MMINSINQLAEAWFNWQVSMLWQVAVLVVIVTALDLVLKRWAWPKVRYALWLLVLIKLVVPPGFSSPLSIISNTPEIAAVRLDINRQTGEPVDRHSIPAAQLPVADLSHDADVPGRRAWADEPPRRGDAAPAAAMPEPSLTVSQPAETTSTAALADNTFNSYSYLLGIWIAGMICLAGWVVIRFSQIRRQCLAGNQQLPERFWLMLKDVCGQVGLRKCPPVVLSDRVNCPAVFGVFRPTILMPAKRLKKLSRPDMENILLHELSHIKRGDLLVHALGMVLQIIYWFNPLVWLARRRIRNIRELCCDASVARILKERTRQYRATLLETARELLAERVDMGMGLLGLFEDSNKLAERLRWLEKKTWRFGKLQTLTVLVVAVLMLGCVLPMARSERAIAIYEPTGQNEFIVTLPNGATVELVGICQHPGEGKLWWKPDGTPLQYSIDTQKVNYDHSVIFDGNAEDKLEIVIKCVWPDLTHEDYVGFDYKGFDNNVMIANTVCRILSVDQLGPRSKDGIFYSLVVAVPKTLTGQTAEVSIGTRYGLTNEEINRAELQRAVFTDVVTSALINETLNVRNKDRELEIKSIFMAFPDGRKWIRENTAALFVEVSNLSQEEKYLAFEYYAESGTAGYFFSPGVISPWPQMKSIPPGWSGTIEYSVSYPRFMKNGWINIKLAKCADATTARHLPSDAEILHESTYYPYDQPAYPNYPNHYWIIPAGSPPSEIRNQTLHNEQEQDTVPQLFMLSGSRPRLGGTHGVRNYQNLIYQSYIHGFSGIYYYYDATEKLGKAILLGQEFWDREQSAEPTVIALPKLPVDITLSTLDGREYQIRFSDPRARRGGSIMSGPLRGNANDPRKQCLIQYNRIADGTYVLPLSASGSFESILGHTLLHEDNRVFEGLYTVIFNEDEIMAYCDYPDPLAKSVLDDEDPVKVLELQRIDDKSWQIEKVLVRPKSWLERDKDEYLSKNPDAVVWHAAKIEEYMTNRISSADTANHEGKFIATLPSGVTVELLGICEHPGEGTQWWRPGGTVLDDPPFDSSPNRVTPSSNYRAYDFAIRYTNIPDGMDTRFYAEPSIAGSGGTLYTPVKKDGQELHHYQDGRLVSAVSSLATLIHKDEKTCTVRVGVSDGPWTTRYESGKSETGRFSVSARADAESGVVFGRPVEQDRQTWVPVTFTINTNLYEVRTVAICQDGRLHRPIRTQGAKAGQARQRTVCFDVPVEELSALQLQVREYKWVEFKDVALRRNVEQRLNAQEMSTSASDTDAEPIEGDSFADDHWTHVYPDQTYIRLVAVFNPEQQPVRFWDPQGRPIPGLDEWLENWPESLYRDNNLGVVLEYIPVAQGIVPASDGKHYMVRAAAKGNPVIVHSRGWGPWQDITKAQLSNVVVHDGNWYKLETVQPFANRQVRAAMHYSSDTEFGIRLVAVDEDGNRFPMAGKTSFIGSTMPRYYYVAMADGIGPDQVSHIMIQKQKLDWAVIGGFATELNGSADLDYQPQPFFPADAIDPDADGWETLNTITATRSIERGYYNNAEYSIDLPIEQPDYTVRIQGVHTFDNSLFETRMIGAKKNGSTVHSPANLLDGNFTRMQFTFNGAPLEFYDQFKFQVRPYERAELEQAQVDAEQPRERESEEITQSAVDDDSEWAITLPNGTRVHLKGFVKLDGPEIVSWKPNGRIVPIGGILHAEIDQMGVLAVLQTRGENIRFDPHVVSGPNVVESGTSFESDSGQYTLVPLAYGENRRYGTLILKNFKSGPYKKVDTINLPVFEFNDGLFRYDDKYLEKYLLRYIEVEKLTPNSFIMGPVFESRNAPARDSYLALDRPGSYHEPVATRVYSNGQRLTFEFAPEQLQALVSYVLDTARISYKNVSLVPGQISDVQTDIDFTAAQGQPLELDNSPEPTGTDDADLILSPVPYNTIIEQQLSTSDSQLGFDGDLFSFSTNTVYEFPEQVKFWDIPDWMAQRSIDVICVRSDDGPTLTGNARINIGGSYGGNICKFVPTNLSMGSSYDDLAAYWHEAESQEIADHKGWDNLPARFFFRTRNGDAGIVEIREIDDLNQSLEFRYKLFAQNADLATATETMNLESQAAPIDLVLARWLEHCRENESAKASLLQHPEGLAGDSFKEMREVLTNIEPEWTFEGISQALFYEDDGLQKVIALSNGFAAADWEFGEKSATVWGLVQSKDQKWKITQPSFVELAMWQRHLTFVQRQYPSAQKWTLHAIR